MGGRKFLNRETLQQVQSAATERGWGHVNHFPAENATPGDAERAEIGTADPYSGLVLSKRNPRNLRRPRRSRPFAGAAALLLARRPYRHFLVASAHL
jgi:hypothetical protein